MNILIILAVNYNSYYKNKVVNNIVETFDLNNSVELKYNIKKLIYKSLNEIIKFLDADINKYVINYFIEFQILH